MTAPARTLTREEAMLPLPESRQVKLEQLRAGICRWPLGTWHEPASHFCGADTGDVTCVYCPTHQLRAVTPRAALPPRKERAA